jgi:hypothetical protein
MPLSIFAFLDAKPREAVIKEEKEENYCLLHLENGTMLIVPLSAIGSPSDELINKKEHVNVKMNGVQHKGRIVLKGRK